MKRLVALAVVVLVAGCAQVKGWMGEDWTSLLDGTKGMENWNRVGNANWRAVDGAVQADNSVKGAGYLVSKKSYGDFALRVEFWASDDANSGIYMRCANPQVITDKSCYEANIFDQRPDPTYGTGAIVHLAKVAPMPKAGGKWNTYEITARGSKLSVVLNGRRTAELDDKQFASGPLALQWGRGVIKFRKVEVRPL